MKQARLTSRQAPPSEEGSDSLLKEHLQGGFTHLPCISLGPSTRGKNRLVSSHVFTRIMESRNQYLVQSKLAGAAGLKLKPHSAKDTLDFLKKHFAKESSDQLIIK